MIVVGFERRRIVGFLFFFSILLHGGLSRPAGGEPVEAPGAAAAPGNASGGSASGGNSGAAPAIALPTIEESQQRLADVAASTELSAELKAQLTEELEKLIETLKLLDDARARRTGYEEQAASAPDEIKKFKAELDRTPPPAPQVSIGTPLETVRELKAEQEALLAAVKKSRSETQIEITDRKTRRAQSPQMVADLRTELQGLESQASTESDDKTDPRLIIARRIKRTARVELIREWLALHQQDQRTAEAVEELLPLRLQVYDREIARLEKIIATLTQAVSSRRESKVEEALQAHRKLLLDNGVDPDSSTVLKLGPKWTELVKNHGEVQREKIAAEAQAEKLATDLKATRDEILRDLARNGSLRSGLGLKLQRQRTQLPIRGQLQAEIAEIDVQIEEMGSLKAQLEMMIEEMEGRDAGMRSLRPAVANAVASRELAQLQEIHRDVDKYTMDLIDLETHLETVLTTTAEFRNEIDSNVLWIRNAQPYALSDPALAWTSFQELMHPANLRSLWDTAVYEALRRPDIVLLWLILSGLLIGFGSRLRRQVAAIGEVAAKRNQTSMRPTMAVIWRCGLLSLPLVVLLGIPGWRLTTDSNTPGYAQAVGNALMLIAAAVLPLELARQLVRRNGLAVLHFGLSEEHAHVVRRSLRFAIDIGLPLMLLWGIAFNYGKTSISSSLARPLFFSGMGLMAFAVWRIMHPRTGLMAGVIEKRYGGWLDRLRYVWHPALTAIPLVLGGLSLAGYSYSARQLAEQLYWTLWLVLGLVVIGGLMRRWVTISRRRLILAQARQRASEAERRDGAPIEVAPENTQLDITEINAQTLRLIHAVLTVMTVVGLWYMWADVLPAVKFLDGTVLWDSGALDDDGKPIPVTLANVLMTLPVLLLTFVSVRNLPGLMETVLLQRLPLESGARYAIATLSSYVMLMVGTIISANTLGLRWESIQWLVAALGVGLGFGLQEIFANFVSGVILLFEQPIRVGDVVTIDGTTGAVQRIRMRATTVINWDRQELIIPNKDLITGRLINWTLTDSTNRVVINVGVAFGSDTRMACTLLEQICRDHPNVSDDPEPVVAFDQFGESSLKLVARCYLKTIDVRVRTIHELNTEIHERFKEVGLEIPFPQRDLNIRMVPAAMESLLHESKAA
ncbi:mechanosensitive ion channel domain-containing protein [Candidatus Laterigemmans baculatus]|uniref:mechanosensitive ion channel domain-containing protein n=1 Tax=Candidatus Laterigemmans baculatus TaxID=2770505 RepID=UPI0013DAF2A3|nr:mechanosensitive ion channel domain-containing protein [Candidatus Laterigemmans baculatus]